MTKQISERCGVFTMMVLGLAAGEAQASTASNAASAAACSAGAAVVDTYKTTYKTNVTQYNLAIGMLKAAPIKTAKSECASAGKSLHDALPALEDAVEKLDKLLFRKNGDERKIIDWIILGSDLSDALTDLQPRLEKLMPLLTKLDDSEDGLRGLAGSLSNLQIAAGSMSTLSSKLDSCSDWTAAKDQHPKAKTLANTGLDSLAKALKVLELVQKRADDISAALESAKNSFELARSRIKTLIGNDLTATETRVAVLFIPAAPLIYTGEYIKDKLGLGKDRLRQFAGVSESNWKIAHTKSNSDAVAKAIREAIFPKLNDTEETVKNLVQVMKDYEGKLPGIITQLANAQTGLSTLNPTLQASVFPATPCQACWFAE
jgi:hypothetical protein